MFFSPEISKGDNVKNKRKFSPFFKFFFTCLSPLHCHPFSIFCPFTWLGGTLKVGWNHDEIRVIEVGMFSTVVMNPVRYIRFQMWNRNRNKKENVFYSFAACSQICPDYPLSLRARRSLFSPFSTSFIITLWGSKIYCNYIFLITPNISNITNFTCPYIMKWNEN